MAVTWTGNRRRRRCIVGNVKRGRWALLALWLLSSVGAASCGDSDCAATATCVAANDDAGMTDGYPEVPPPPGCDPGADSNGSAACVDDSYALFVDPKNGNDTNAGTKAAPLRTLAAATSVDKLAGRPRIHVCGTAAIAETVRLPPNVSLVGGFDCQAWQYSGVLVRIAPTEPGIVLHVDGSTKEIVVSDVELIARDGEGDGASSVALFINGSKATLRRVTAQAGAGASASQPPTPSNRSSSSLDGNGTTNDVAADGKTCSCSKQGASIGGKGGGLGAAGAPGGVDPPTQGGGTAGAAGCTDGGRGANGAKGGAGGKRAAALGVLTAAGWKPGRGGDGTFGDPGAGGGGGGGNAAFAGGGGACGGCGGHGGTGGEGGGASIALALLMSDVKVVGGRYSAAQAGAGAWGGQGESGASGGARGSSACFGGSGGHGAGGGGGAGGAGGVSTAVHRGASHWRHVPAGRRGGARVGQGGRPWAGGHPRRWRRCSRRGR